MAEISCFLVGPTGSGKTTVGRMLASFLAVKFADCNKEIENLTGQNIINFWKEHGQEAFTKLETKVLNNLTFKKNMVLATSSCSVTLKENRNLFSTHGKTIYLAAHPVNQYTRSMLSGNPSPLLVTAKNKLSYLMELTKTMEPLYSSVADFVITTDNYSIEEVVNKIIDYLYCGVIIE